VDVISTPRQRAGRGRAAADEEVLGMKHKQVAAILAVIAPSGPCDGKADHPHCPGPH
jgi:hypothetical protein